MSKMEERAETIHSKWKQLKAVGQDSNDYHRGVVNGLAIACGILHGHEPKLISKPGEVSAPALPASVQSSAPVAAPISAPVAEKPKKEKKSKKPAASEPPAA